jgi:DNA-binding NarL/FixJ family response regulator
MNDSPLPVPSTAQLPDPSTAPLPDKSVKALVIDDHEATRLGTALVLRRQAWVARCLLAADASAAVHLIQRHRPEVAVLDISNAGPFVTSATGRLHEAHPGMAIVLTSRCRLALPGPPQSLGAVAFLPPGTPAREIAAAARAAVLSISYQHTDPLPAPSAELTDRERDLLLLISEGATNREIADRLHLGPDSIKKSASALYRKLGVRNRTEAAQRSAGLLIGDGS